MNYLHSPVLLNEVISYLVDENSSFFIDCTVGEGGHSEEILRRFNAITVYALDRDKEILEVAKSRLSIFRDRFKPFNINFKDISLKKLGLDKPIFDAALMDLGISVYHYKKSMRGFSFASEEKLDMTLDNESINVFDIVNNFTEEELLDIFYKYGEEKFSKFIIRNIINARETKKITTSKELADIIKEAIPVRFRSKNIHPATKCFQALRIFANNEIENIKKGIPNVLSLLKTGGKLGVITFHSIEDRTVKEIFKKMESSCICPKEVPVCVCGKKREVNILTKKGVQPTLEEIKNNAPSRSAKLRVVEKL